MADYKDKIRKLLALAESPEEEEAKAALLRARELMAKHKLTEADLEGTEKQAVKDVLTDITCGKRRDPWAVGLSAIVGENYCCKGYRTHNYHQQTQRIGFIGFEEDLEICVAIFKYAVDCIRAGIKNVKKENAGHCQWYVKKQCDSYGFGFINGIREALEGQDEERRGEWGLVLAIPQEVQEIAQRIGHEPFRARSDGEIDPRTYAQGYAEGKEFDPAHRIGDGVN